MRFHLALFSFTLCDLERSIQVTQVFNGLYKITIMAYKVMAYIRYNIRQDNRRFTIGDG